MSLVKSPRLTAKKLTAFRRNAALSHGPATREGLGRIRASQLRHGLYSQSEEAVLHVLGEDAREFRALKEGLRRQWRPADIVQEKLVGRLARALWRTERSDRMQEARIMQRAREVDHDREDRLHARLMRLRLASGTLQSLARSVARRRYVATTNDINLMLSLHQEGMVKEMGEIALGFFYELRPPDTPELAAATEAAEYEALAERVVNRARRIFGLGPRKRRPRVAAAVESGATPQAGQAVAAAPAGAPSPDGPPVGAEPAAAGPQEGQPAALAPSDATPREGEAVAAVPTVAPPQEDEPAAAAPSSAPPQESQPVVASSKPAREEDRYREVTEATWEKRQPVRRLLKSMLDRFVQACEADRDAVLKEYLQGPTPYDRAAEVALVEPNQVLMHRIENADLRQVSTIVSLLKSAPKPAPASKKTGSCGTAKKAHRSNDVKENKRG